MIEFLIIAISAIFIFGFKAAILAALWTWNSTD